MFGKFLNKIPSYEDDVIKTLGESIYQYSLKLRNYYDYKKGEQYMLFQRDDASNAWKKHILFLFL